MIFSETLLKGAFTIGIEPVRDDRGFFARTWCQKEFEEHGLDVRWVQSSTSVNRSRGTLRGMHYQVSPHEEIKLVRCTRGSVYDVIVDLRPESPTFRHSYGTVLSSENCRSLYIPKEFAHGFLTLEDHSEVIYYMSEFYSASSARGFRWNDPAFDIRWPEAALVMSEKDRTWPDFGLNN